MNPTILSRIESRHPLCLLALASAVLLMAFQVQALPRQQRQGSTANLSAYNWAFNQCVQLSGKLQFAERRDFLDGCCGAVESACQDYCVQSGGVGDTECLADCSWFEYQCTHGWQSFTVVAEGSAHPQSTFSQPVVEEINPSPRADFCLDGDTGCGAPAAHTICQRELGYGWGARFFQGDGIPASQSDPTWQLGRWYPRQPYGTGQGFGLIECEPLDGRTISFEDVPLDADFDGVSDLDDNCPLDPNPFQRNGDGDVFGDYCDLAPETSFACSNGIDDDGDGIIDGDDPGCLATDDNDEGASHLVCDNGLDDDGDGQTDLSDSDCSSPTDASESAARCADGVDDDGDGLADLNDPGCTSAIDDSEFGDVWSLDFDDTPMACSYPCNYWSWAMGDYPRELADVDGDGRPDIVAFGEHGVDVALAEESGFAASARWTNDFGVSDLRTDWTWGEDLPPRFVRDVDGDGRGDLIAFTREHVYVKRSTGAGFGPREAWSVSGELGADRFLSRYDPDGEARMIDLDGDGLEDLVVFAPEGALFARNTGSSFASPVLWSDELGSAFPSAFASSLTSRHFGDLNGDGLLDFVGFTTSETWVALSTGEGFEPAWRGHGELGHLWGAIEHRFLADIDGDGDDDVIAFDSTHVRVARGEPEGLGTIEFWLSHFGAWQRDFRQDMRIVEDLNGDGMADLLLSDGQGVSAWHSTGDGYSERMLLGYGYTSGPAEWWTEDGSTPRRLADVDGDGEDELVGFGRDGVIVAELGRAADPLPVPVPEPGFGLMLAVGTGVLGARIRRRGSFRRACHPIPEEEHTPTNESGE